MKPLTKTIRAEVKELIVKRGTTQDIKNTDITELFEKYTTEHERKVWTDSAVETMSMIQNQINYFRYAKGL